MFSGFRREMDDFRRFPGAPASSFPSASPRHSREGGNPESTNNVFLAKAGTR